MGLCIKRSYRVSAPVKKRGRRDKVRWSRFGIVGTMDTEFAQLVESVFTMHMMSPEVDSLKKRLKETWSAGDYDYFSRYMERDARAFYERIHVPAGAKLLDVGCGSGQLALWAARDGAKVVGVDIAP